MYRVGQVPDLGPLDARPRFTGSTGWLEEPAMPRNVTCNIESMASTRDRVREHRQRLREQGLRPIQIWVPDVRAPEFVAEAHRQSAAIAACEQDADDQQFVDTISTDWGGDVPEGSG